MLKFTKIASVLALSLGVVGAANAVNGDTSKITGLRWVADLTTQVTSGNMVVVDSQNNIIGNSSEFELRGVQNDLSIVETGTDSLFAKNFTDANADNIAQQDEVDLDSAVPASWALTDAKYEVRTVSGQTLPTEVEPTITFNGESMTVNTSGSETTTDDASEIAIGISSVAPTSTNFDASEATQAIVTLSILAVDASV